jgi:hypothetical protein
MVLGPVINLAGSFQKTAYMEQKSKEDYTSRESFTFLFWEVPD